eukprot:scaffold1269_cov400-Prasinococcus_capsulatus_cf.AAC.11
MQPDSTYWISARASATCDAEDNATRQLSRPVAGQGPLWHRIRGTSTRSFCLMASESSFSSSWIRETRSLHRSALGMQGLGSIGIWKKRWNSPTLFRLSGCSMLEPLPRAAN